MNNIEENGLKHEVEVEYKAMLTEEKYEELNDYFSEFAEAKEPYIQTNYYFDTEDYFFIKQGITVRLRNKKEKWFLQIKKPQLVEGEFNQQEEVSCTISEEEANSLIDQGIDKKNKLFADLINSKGVDISTIKMIGSLQTKRNDYIFYTDIISLDQNTYLGTTDYELEWETSNHKFVEYQIDQLYLNLIKKEGKVTRFLDRLVSGEKM